MIDFWSEWAITLKTRIIVSSDGPSVPITFTNINLCNILFEIILEYFLLITIDIILRHQTIIIS